MNYTDQKEESFGAWDSHHHSLEPLLALQEGKDLVAILFLNPRKEKCNKQNESLEDVTVQFNSLMISNSCEQIKIQSICVSASAMPFASFCLLTCLLFP